MKCIRFICIVCIMFVSIGGFSQSSGIQVSQDDVIAQSYYKRGHYYFDRKEFSEAIKWYQKAAERGYAIAQNELGYCYVCGYGVSQDYDEAVKWYRKAADQGHAGAQSNLGLCYKNGYGVNQSYSEAAKWYRKAAEQGDAGAQTNLGFCYEYALGVSQDYDETVKWYRKAVDQGHAIAQNNLGVCYEFGHGVPTNIEEAKRWYKSSAALGYKKAKANLARLGGNVNPNPTPAKQKASVTWLAYEPTTEQKDYPIKIGIKSDSKIEDVSVYVNDVLTRGINPVANDGFNMTIDRTVALNDGRNTIKVLVKNAGGVASTEKTVTYQKQDIATIDWLAFSPTTTEKQFALRAGIKSTSKIESWTVTVNDVVERGINPVKNDGYSMAIDKVLTLAEGNNVIKIEVRNAGGVAMTEKNVVYTAKHVASVVRQKRIALVMGNANYRDADKRLKNPVNDANDVAEKLESLGFKVIRSLDQSRQGMEMAINDFGNQARNYEVALFYYAGHGVRSKGNNYMIPVDANLPEESYVQYNCTNTNLVLDLMEKANCPMKIMILDACRNNPFARSWNRDLTDGGLGIMNAPKGTFIAFSTAPGDVAQDGTGRNSPYTAALLQTLDIPNLSITVFFQEVLEKVASTTGERQTPWTSNSFRGKFYFNKK